MSKKPESRRQRSIRRAIQAAYPSSFFFKVHGGPFQAEGLPDLVGSVNGFFFGFEVKEPDEQPTPLQIETIKMICESGAVGAVIETAEEALRLISDRIGTTRRLSIRRR